MHSQKQFFGFLLTVIIFTAFVVFMAGCGQQQAEIEKQKEITRLIIEEVWNKGNFDLVEEYYAPNYVYHPIPLPDIKGIDAFKKFIEYEHTVLPDFKISIEDIVVEEERIVVRGTFSGTYQAVSLEKSAYNGKRLDFKFCMVSRKVNGKIVEDWNYMDRITQRQQLGYTILPPITESTFAMVTMAQLKPGKLEDLVKLEKEMSVPLLKSYKEFRGFYFMGDVKTGKVCGISLWDNQESVTEAMQSEKVKAYFQEFADKTRDFFKVKPVREAYTVTVQE